jgi:hypothetical protein
MRNTLKLLLLVLFMLIVVFTVLVFDTSPAIDVNATKQVNNADSVQPLIDELRKSLRGRYKAQQINVSADQANSIAGFLHRALEQANAHVSFSEQEVVVAGTLKIETGIFPVYLNIKAIVLEGDTFHLDSLTIGDLYLPGDFALGLAESLVNAYTSSLVATKSIETVTAIVVENNAMQLQLAPLDGLLREFKNIETGGSDKDTHILKIRIAHYLRLLDTMYVAPTSGNTNNPSLSVYLHGLMQEAAILSEQGSATLENEAAILALAIFAGSGRFTTIIGDLSFAIERIPTASPRPMLRDRRDLSLHFIFSAAIKLLSQKGISIAVGEFKELMDRGQGGSGYSFVDLAADLSGTHFADLAVNPRSAQKLQEVMQNIADESLFMVSIDGLDEGLSKSQFTEQYGEVDSDPYQQVVNEINTRISALPISQ